MSDCRRKIHPFIAYFYIKINGVVEINEHSMQDMMMIQEKIYGITADADFTPGGIGYITPGGSALKKEFVDTKIMNNSGKTFSLNEQDKSQSRLRNEQKFYQNKQIRSYDRFVGTS